MKAIITNGAKFRQVYDGNKSINPWDPDDSPQAWTGGPEAANSTELVPAIYAAWQARCKAMADLPFSIYGKGGKVVDVSDDYQNAVGFMPNPRMFFWLSEASLVGYGRAYWGKAANKYKFVKELKYFAPDTIEPQIDAKNGLVGFKRQVNSQSFNYQVDEVLYTWLPDPAVEIGAPTVYPLRSALMCAGALDRINYFVADYMARGAVKAMLLSAKGMPDKNEAERVEKWFNRFMRGVGNNLWKLFNAEMITPTVIGEGLEAFSGITIVDDLKRQIHEAMGTRQMLEDENYATAQIRQREFYVNTIMPDARLISDTLNEQIFRSGEQEYWIEFEPERLEAFQTDESERAGALSTLVTALGQPVEQVALAMDILGYDLTDEQRDMFEAMRKAKEENRPDVTPEGEERPETDSVDVSAEDEKRDELAKFYRKACKHVGKDVKFVSDAIPCAQAQYIHSRLCECLTEAEIKAVFDASDGSVTQTPGPQYDSTTTPPAPHDAGLMAVADALREAVKAMAAQPQAQPAPSFTVNLPSGMVQVTNDVKPSEVVQAPAPAVTVNVPEQAAPVVNVTNEVKGNPPDESKDVVKAVRKLARGK